MPIRCRLGIQKCLHSVKSPNESKCTAVSRVQEGSILELFVTCWRFFPEIVQCVLLLETCGHFKLWLHTGEWWVGQIPKHLFYFVANYYLLETNRNTIKPIMHKGEVTSILEIFVFRIIDFCFYNFYRFLYLGGSCRGRVA